MIRLFSYEKYANRRDELGLTDYQVAKQSGVKTCTLSEWKNHYKSNGLRGYCPKLEKMTAIAKVLKMEVSQLINSESQDDRKEIVLNELQIFNSNEFGQIRTVQLNNETYFVGKDIADNLGYQNGSRDINRHVDEEDRHKVMLFDGNQDKETIIINESGLYSLILSSKMPNAKKFKHWVTSEVLPSIRKTGAYQIPQTTAGQIQLLAQGHMDLLGKIEAVEKDFNNFKQEMPLLAIECQQIIEVKNRRVVDLLGGKKSNAYKDASLRGKVYKDLEKQLRREFDVTSYKAIHRSQTSKAIEIIKAYTLPYCLQGAVDGTNAQMDLETYTEASL